MKIFFIFVGSTLKKNASTTHQLELFSNLNKLVQIFLFLPKTKKNNLPNIIQIPQFHFPILGILFYQILLFFYLSTYYFKYFPDVLYTRFSELNFAPIILSKIFQIPIIIEVNGLRREEKSMMSNHFFDSQNLIILCEKFILKSSTYIIAVTENIKFEIEQNYGNKNISVIPNGANTDLFTPLDQEKTQNLLQLNPEKYYVSYIGSLMPWQGVEYLIKAAPFALRDTSNIEFLIIGEGELTSDLKKLALELGVLEHIIFIGAVSYEQVPQYINASTLCVVPKKPLKSGYSPLKLYECMSCGKPVIATRTIGFEILERNSAGILINPENSVEFANAILLLINNEKLRNQMGINGRNYVKNNHTWYNVAKEIYDICKIIVN